MLRHALLPLCAALLYTVSLPPFGYGLVAFLVAAPLARLVLDPARPLSFARAWAVGLLFGEAATLGVGGHWLYVAAHEYFGEPRAFSLGFTLVTTITHAGVFIAAGVASSAPLARLRSPYLRAAAFAATWVAFELLRARLLYGCPWNFLGHALARHPELTGAAAYGGAYALSALCVLTGALVGQALGSAGWRSRLTLLGAGLAVPVLLAAFGAGRLASHDPGADPPEARLTVGLVQPGVGRHELWDPAQRGSHLDRLLTLSRAPELAGVDLVIWPENAVPFLLDADLEARGRIAELARETGAYVMTGAPRSESRADGSAAFFNSVYLFAPDGRPHEVYDKRKLLPYIEEIPAFARNLAPRTNGIEYTPGSERPLFDVAGWKIAPLICFESTYPQLAREAAIAGADLLVNLSNDSWFDGGAASEQHFGMTTLRTVETGLALVRVANTGVTAIVDAEGRISLELPTKRSVAARQELRRPKRDQALTVYARWGDVFAWACVAIAATGAVVASRRRNDASA